MKRAISLVLLFASLITVNGLTQAQDNSNISPSSQASAPKVVLPPGITEEMLAPPPVPSFMLTPPASPLSVDEMVQQARQAEQKAGIKPAPPVSTN